MGIMGAIYGFHKPLANAARPRDQWQVYDIRYRAPRRDTEGKIVEEGSITAWLNGQKVQDHARVGEPRSKYHPYRYGTTPYLQKIWKQQKQTMIGPVFLQDHDNPVKFRNVWLRPLDDKTFRYEPNTSGCQDRSWPTKCRQFKMGRVLGFGPQILLRASKPESSRRGHRQ